MKTNNKYLLRIVAICVVLLSLGMGSVQAAEHCADSYSIDKTLASGARWDMCWTHNNNHGIRYHHIYYTPKNGTRRMVLMDAAVSQIHVPYDDNGARYHDVSDYGLGGSYLRNLSSSECAGGTLRQYGSKNVVCTQVQKKGAAYRFSSTTQQAEVLKVFSIAKVGAYIYTPQWLFHDDGRIEPSMLATGSLQRYSSSAERGWLLTGNRIGLSHVHNYFWRLDFDINGTANNDIAKEINYTSSGGKRTRSTTTLSTEAARSLSPTKQRSWLISDGSQRNAKNHLIGYEIRLSEAGHREVGPAYEAYSHNDFYVTRANDCEQIASHNSRINSGCSDSLDKFVNGQSLSGQDLVAWVGVSFYHMPRSEDYPKMDAHSNRFEIIPRDWHAENPLVRIASQERPVAKADSANASGDEIEINVLANDTGSGLSISDYNRYSQNGATVTLSGNKLVYKQAANFNGNDSFWYVIKDSFGRTSSAKVTISVTGGGTFNPFPVGKFDTATATSGNAITIDVLANDIGNGLVLNEPTPWSQQGGRIALINNKFSYTPKPGFNGADKFWYTFKDVLGRSNWAEVNISVSGNGTFNPFPVGKHDTASTTAGNAITIDVLANDIGNGLVLDDPTPWSQQGGRVALIANKFSYTPKSGFTGADKFWYTFQDVQGRRNWAEVNINVTAANTAYPVAVVDNVSTAANTEITIDVLANDTGSGLSIGTFNAYSVNGGTVRKSNNRLIYSPKNGYRGTDSFWYSIKDSIGRTNAIQVLININ